MVRSVLRDDLVIQFRVFRLLESYEIHIVRPAIGDGFGNHPAVTTKVTVKHNEHVLHDDERAYLTWYAGLSSPEAENRVRVEDTCRHIGYQYYQLHQRRSHIQETHLSRGSVEETGFRRGLSNYSGTKDFCCLRFQLLLTPLGNNGF